VTDSNKTVGSLAGSGKEARDNAKADAARRARAANILTPKEAQSGQWDAGKVLLTTLGGGKPRPITGEDLVAFRRNVGAVANRYQSGITPKQVIDLSLESRRERARKEIHVAIPVYGSTETTKNEPSAVIRFMTNAGPDCKRGPARHHVSVQFLSFFAAVNATGMNARKAAQWLRKERMKFDCDCEDHTYRFRFISSSGKFAYGRVETGYPKERNPLLQGIACKHVIRVMQQIDSGVATMNYLVKMIDKARVNQTGKAIVQETQKNVEATERKQRGKQGKIKTSAQRRQERMAAQARKSAADALKRAPKPKKPKKPTKQEENDAINTLLARNLTPEQILELIARAQANSA
jgi:hypothetical protein